MRSASGAPLADYGSAAILAPGGHTGPVFLLRENFRAIMRYNPSTSYALAVALMNTDRDHDGIPDFDELVAGTDPLNDAAVLRLSTFSTTVSNQLIFSWPSSSNRLYQLEHAATLPVTWQKHGAEMPATPPLNYCTNTLGSGSHFYRLGVRR